MQMYDLISDKHKQRFISEILTIEEDDAKDEVQTQMKLDL